MKALSKITFLFLLGVLAIYCYIVAMFVLCVTLVLMGVYFFLKPFVCIFMFCMKNELPSVSPDRRATVNL